MTVTLDDLEAENDGLRKIIGRLEAKAERLQQAVDAAHGALSESQYVGGPTQREAWRTASDALGAVVTQHKGQPA